MKSFPFQINLLVAFLLSSAIFGQEHPDSGISEEASEEPIPYAAQTKAAVLTKRYKRKPSFTALKQIQPKPLSRIVGGEDSQKNAYPWMTAIVNSSQANLFDAQFCGGALIHPYWVVTAAHCVVGSSPDSIEIVLGAHNLLDPTGTQRISVSEIIIHPDYRSTPEALNIDVALLRLATPAQTQFTPLPLISEDSLEETNTLVRAIGWGSTSSNQSSPNYPNILQEVDIPIVSLATANGASSYNNQLSEFMLPAGLAAGGKDSCQGDSGGPLVTPSPIDGGWALAGITSFGDGCAQANLYGIYTRVSSFRKFILDHIYPNYIKWEQAQSTRGELRDPDNDGHNNMEEFAFLTNPLQPDTAHATFALHENNSQFFQAIKLKKPTQSQEIDYTIQHKSNLTEPTWQNFDFENLVVASEPITNSPTVSLTTSATTIKNESPIGFLRIQATPNKAPIHAPRPLACSGGANGHLTRDDLIHPLFPNRFQKIYRLENLAPNEQVTLTGRSPLFDVRLELLNADDGTVIQAATSNSAFGINNTDELLTLTPNPKNRYLLRITSETENAVGPFTVACFPESTLPTISETSTLNQSLISSDSSDPFRLPNTFHIDQFSLQTHSFAHLKVSLFTSQFNSNLTILDAETKSVVFHSSMLNNLSSELNFRPTPGLSYIIQASSIQPSNTGNYNLSIEEFIDTSIPVTIPNSLNSSLSINDDTDPDFPLSFKDDYRIENLTPGQIVTITMSSTQIDSFLVLINANTGATILTDDDSAGGLNSTLSFTVQNGANYIIRSTSAEDSQTGTYTLSFN